MLSVIRYLLIAFVIWVMSLFHAHAQDKPLIQVSGVIMSNDTSHSEIPFSTVFNKTLKLGSYANNDGFYTTVAHAGDTIIISCIGYLSHTFVVPDENALAYIHAVYLAPKAYLLTEATVYPWGTREQFREAFLYMDVPDDDLTRSRKNLSADNMQRAAAGLPKDGGEVSSLYMKQYQNSFYTKGAVPQNNLLNPLAWAQFFNSLSSGSK